MHLLPAPPIGAAGAPGFWTLDADGAVARRLVPAGLPDAAMFAAMLESSETIPC